MKNTSEAAQKTHNVVIGSIVKRFSALPASTFQFQNSEALLIPVKDFLSDCEMDESRYLELTYGEILGTIELIPSVHFYRLTYGEEYCRNMRLAFLRNIVNLLMECYTFDTPVFMFISMTVKDYLDYLSSKSGTDHIYTEFKNTVLKDTAFLISDDTTIKQFLDKIYLIQNQSWVPINPIRAFEEDIRRSYEILYSFFIAYFKEAFPEYFDLERLKEKYKPRVKPRGM